ncbi:halocyanin domain-containing protein [Haloarcula salinisoli]|uniref:Halocyanin domain-containing protein n=1 Tax=Haloarcula salinisoli TaxID=2487746 RepID=A0A8J7YEJ7_9EURY|nr:halocyanin domain-containing protein [Halomicroarcula salinisoli]MBX0304027.1 halocyanin domain-containing protein [Halomicroarcula salinisoli]
MYDRRTVLAGTFGAVAALAGCQGSGDSGTPSGTPTGTATPAQMMNIDYGEWFADTDNFDGTVDMRGQSSVTVSVGAAGNSGDFAFDPPAIRVDPGTTVVWEWTGNGGEHNVVADDDSFRSGDPVSGDNTYERTFDTEGIHLYFCDPHDSLGMRGAVVAGDPSGGGGGGGEADYGFEAATFDAYWYSLYNMSTNIAMSGNGVPFPLNEQMEQLQSNRMPAMLENSEVDQPPIANPNLSLASFTEGDPAFTQQPVLEDDSGRPDASTLAWDKSQSSGIVSPSSVGWTHLKGVTWAKNFQAHFDLLPEEMAPKFRAQLLSTLAQVGINAAILVGGSRENGALTAGDSFEFLSEYRPSAGEIVDDTHRPHHHAAMLWFLSDMNSLAQNGWFGYENPRPLIPANAGDDAVFDPPVGIQGIADGVASATMDLFEPRAVAQQESTRSVGLMLAATGYYGPQAGSDEQLSAAVDYANGLAGVIEDNLDGNGKVANGAQNQAATQGIVGQGLLWASQLDGVDYTSTAEDVLGYMTDELWAPDAGTFSTGVGDDTYAITARDAGDITGGLNAADAVLDMSGAQETFAQFFNGTFNRGRLQRAQRQPSVSDSNPDEPPLPPEAGGEFGQAAVYNGEVEYDTQSGEWSVTDDRFYTGEALYLANQDIWVGNWGGDFYQGRGVPGQSDEPPEA